MSVFLNKVQICAVAVECCPLIKTYRIVHYSEGFNIVKLLYREVI